MALSINWLTKVITIPKLDLAWDSGTLYTLDTNDFRKWLKDIEDSEEGIAHLDTHQHNTAVTVAGVTYARIIEIINGYSVTFEDGQYSVILTGSNNNIWDIASGILNQNQVQVIPTNSAGLIVHTAGSGVLPQDITDIADAVWAHLQAVNKAKVDFLADMEGGRWKIISNQMIFYKADNITEVARFNLFDAAGNPASANVFERRRATTTSTTSTTTT